MFRHLSLAAAGAAVALLAFTATSEASVRHQRQNHKAMPPEAKLPVEVKKAIENEFPRGKVTGWWMEERGELEVMVSNPDSHPIEVLFNKRGGSSRWQLLGFEYPVPVASITPRALHELVSKHPNCKVLETEMVFSSTWTFLGYQVTLEDRSKKIIEVFVTAGGKITKDPL